jgi:5-methylcytosine-specific restriction enzyme A
LPPKPPGLCAECGALVPDGARHCEAHRNDNRELRAAREREAVRRSSGLKSLYDSTAWRVRMRRYILGRDPLCQIAVLCLGRAFSTDLDHIIRAELYIEMHGGEAEYFFDPENVRGACHADHSRKTGLENRGLWNAAEEKKAAAAVAAAELV